MIMNIIMNNNENNDENDNNGIIMAKMIMKWRIMIINNNEI